MSEESLLVIERRRELLRIAKDHGRVLAAEAAKRFGVSEDSIRRDLRAMAAAGLVQRVRGGALPSSGAATYNERSHRAPKSGDVLVRATAARLVEIGGLVALDSGHTSRSVAEALGGSGLTIVTSAPATAAAALAGGLTVHMLGGQVFPDVGASVDATAVDAMRSIRVDAALLGACAFDLSVGVSTPNAHEVSFKRALIESAAEVVLAIPASRVGSVAPFHVAELDDITSVIIDRSAGQDTQAVTALDSVGEHLDVRYV